MKELSQFPGYFVSEKSRIFKAINGAYIELSQSIIGRTISKPGYKSVHIRRKTFYVHHLVAAAYLPLKPFDGAILRHLNGDSFDNRPENLLWGTYQEDAEDKRNCGTMNNGTWAGNSKLLVEQVKEILVAPLKWGVQRELALKFGVSPATISMIRKGRTWKVLK